MSGSTWTWLGTTTAWADASNWQLAPSDAGDVNGYPQSGDTVILDSGTVQPLVLTGSELSNNVVNLSNGAVLDFANGSSLDAASNVYVNGPSDTINVSGLFTDLGNIDVVGGNASLSIAMTGGTLAANNTVDYGLNVEQGNTLLINGGVLQDQEIHVHQGTAVVTNTTFANVSTTDLFSVTGGFLEIAQTTSASPLLSFVAGATIGSTIKLDNPALFGTDGGVDSISGFTTGDTLDLGSNLIGTIEYTANSGYGNLSVLDQSGNPLLTAVFSEPGLSNFTSGTFDVSASGTSSGDGFVVTQGGGQDTIITVGSAAASTPTTWTWIGTTGAYNVSGNWSNTGSGSNGSGYPINGDTAIVPSGTMQISSGALDLAGLSLGGTPGGGAIVTGGANLEVNTGLLMLGSSLLSVDGSSAVDLGTSGGFTAGAVSIDSGVSLVGVGTVSGAVVNNGDITASNAPNPAASSGGTLEITGAVSGTGAITLAAGTTLKLDGAVGAGQSIAFSSGQAANLVLGTPGSSFGNAITGLGSGDEIEFGNGITITGASLQNNNTIAVAFTSGGTTGVYDLTNVSFAPNTPTTFTAGIDATTDDAFITPVSATVAVVQVGDEYQLQGSGGTGPTLQYNGSPVTVGEFGKGVMPIAAAPLSGGGYELAWQVGNTGQFAVWNTDSNGNYTSSPTGVVPAANFTLEQLETSFNVDLNGDGTIGPVGTSLGPDVWQVGGNYVLGSSLASGVMLQYQNAAVTAGEFGNVTPIAAASTGGGYEIAWKVNGTNNYAVWDTNGSGNFTSTPTGVVPAANLALEQLETSFGVDLNGDGTIGPVGTSLGTDLWQVGNNYALGSTLASAVLLQYQNSAVTAGEFGNVTPIAAASTGGGYELAWKVNGTNNYAVWDTDNTGNFTSTPTGVVPAANFTLEQLEPSFGVDLNGDGTTGPVGTSLGQDLWQVGNNYVLGTSLASGVMLQYQNSPVTVGEFGSGVMPFAVASTGGGFELAWNVDGTGNYAVWDTDSSGNFTSTPTGVVTGQSFALEDLEPSFGVDLNGDGKLSSVLVTTTNGSGAVDLSSQTQATTVNLGSDNASASSGLNASSLSFIGTPDTITLGANPDIIEYALTSSSGIEEIANFTYGTDELNLDMLGAANGTLQAFDTSVNGTAAISIYNSSDTSHGVVLLNMTNGQTAADLLANHTTFSGGHALIS